MLPSMKVPGSNRGSGGIWSVAGLGLGFGEFWFGGSPDGSYIGEGFWDW